MITGDCARVADTVATAEGGTEVAVVTGGRDCTERQGVQYGN